MPVKKTDGGIKGGIKMIKQILSIAMVFLFAAGCASTLESVNKGAEKVGETGGKVMRVPHSVGEGAAKGIAGESESNPYGR
jgi:uncharacterized protein YcnI